jgi:hypothetical protein
VERVASASVPDVTQTESTTTMPVALARRAEDDTRTWVRESCARCDALQPAHHEHCAQFSAVCLPPVGRLQHSTRPGLCLIHPGWRPASPEGQPRRQVNSQHTRTKRHSATAAMLPDTATHPDTQTQKKFMQLSTPTQEWESDQHNTRREAGPDGPSHREHPKAHLIAIDGHKRLTV